MKKEIVSLKNIVESIVPITRFNRGEANKVFEEVSEYGTKVVFKNNVPACVLVDPKRYEEMVEALEDYALYFEAEKRMQSAEKEGFISSENVYKKLDINEAELDDIDVELE